MMCQGAADAGVRERGEHRKHTLCMLTNALFQRLQPDPAEVAQQLQARAALSEDSNSVQAPM